MPSSRILISSQTLGSSAASVTFSSIPSTYTDLVLRMSTRSDVASNYETAIQINSISTNYSMTRLVGNGATATSARYTAQSTYYMASTNGTNTTASTFSNLEFYIPNYAGSANKVASGFGVTENNSASTNVSMAIHAELLSNTAAITQLVISAQGNFVAGSSFYLYGLKNS
jgi:hypothetical protein